MTATLILSAGGESVDFVAGTEFKVGRDGLSLPVPEMIRVVGGDPLLREGQALQARRFGNREIIIRFQAVAQTHDNLTAALQKLQRILNYSVRAQQSGGTLAGGTLQVKLDAQSTAVTFDILDGELRLAGPLNQLLKRQGPYLDNELVLIAKPFARGATVRLENFLLNPGFDVNPGETGRDTGYYITFGAAGVRLERADCTGLVTNGPAQFLAGAWAYPTAATGSEQVIMRAGASWEITWTPDDKKFMLYMTDGASNAVSVTSAKAYNLNEWHHVQALALQMTGTHAQQLLLLVVNRKLAGVIQHTLGNLVPSGKFVIGAQDNDTRHFAGRISGAYVLLRNIWPWQLRFLFDYGMRSLIRGTAGDLTGTPPGADYWDLEDAEYGGVWVFDESSGNLADSGPGGRTLTLVGSPTFTRNTRTPAGWTQIGGVAATAWSTLDGSVRKYGPFSYYMHKTTTFTVTPQIEQVVTIPAYKQGASANRDWEFVFWAQPLADGTADSVQVTVTGDDSGALIDVTLNLAAGMKQYGVKFTAGAADTQLTIRFGYVSTTTAMDVYIANLMLLPGSPFGLSTTLGQLATETPWISSRFMISNPQFLGADIGRSRTLKIHGLPGDEPLATRVYVESPSS